MQQDGAGADAGAQGQLLAHAGEAGRPAHPLRLDVGVAQGVDAGELQRAEEAADQQHRQDHERAACRGGTARSRPARPR